MIKEDYLASEKEELFSAYLRELENFEEDGDSWHLEEAEAIAKMLDFVNII